MLDLRPSCTGCRMLAEHKQTSFCTIPCSHSVKTVVEKRHATFASANQQPVLDKHAQLKCEWLGEAGLAKYKGTTVMLHIFLLPEESEATVISDFHKYRASLIWGA